jgi:hypothetical protein
MDRGFYFDRLYPLQDEILRLAFSEDTRFYLAGGTAASRGYLHHRFSDDLDLFVNDDDRFGIWSERLIEALSRSDAWKLTVVQREARFIRSVVQTPDIDMKIEMVNDVRSRIGTVREHTELGRLDTAENLLANKITALLDREEPKDLADIWGFACLMKLPLAPAISGAQGKAAGVFPADLARVLCSATPEDWEVVRWINAPPLDQFLGQLRELGESLIL